MAELEWPVSVREKFPKLSLRQVLLLQAHIRGFIVRSHLKQVRDEFLEVFNEVQQNDDLYVYWRSRFPCLPTFTTVNNRKEELKCSQKSEGPREVTAVESNSGINEENPLIPRGSRDEDFDDDRLSPASPQPPAKTSDEPVVDDEEPNFQDRVFDDLKQENENLISGKKIHQLPVSKECFVRPNAVEQDSESMKDVVCCDESQPKSSKSTSNQQGHQALPVNRVCIPKGKDIYSQEPSNIDDTNSSSCFKLCEKSDKNGFQNLDSSFTDVTSVWGSDISLSISGNSRSATPYPETVASLQLQRQNIALELVWLQQAILSRKNYLRLKSQLDCS